MHNCSQTKEQITELLLDGADRSPDEALSAELRRCAECRAEFSSLSATLRITTRLREAAAPAEMYWASYHAKLRQKLFRATTQRRKAEAVFSFAPLGLCGKFLKSSVSVPVPLGIATLIAFSTLGLFAIRSAGLQVAPTPSPAVVHVPVEVPVVQKKVITRVVYRERRSRTLKESAGSKFNTIFAKSRSEELPTSLIGFKPTDEIKLTVIKGGSSNEK